MKGKSPTPRRATVPGGILPALLLACLLAPILAVASSSTNNEPPQQLRLQLNWKHQFEFAGHYAAIEKGFYRRRGLDVELVEYQDGIDVIDEVITGNADYGLFSLQIIEERLKGKPITLLANYFKRYPLAILSQPGITSLEELRGKRLMIADKDLHSSLMRYLFHQAALVPGENLVIVPHSFSTQPFIADEVDALSAYLSNEPFELQLRKKAYQIIDLASSFPALGGNYLFTRETATTDLIARHHLFTEATNEGWRYALAHPDEIIDLILEKYSTRKSREALQFEANKTRNFIMPNAFSIGSIQPERLQAVANMLREMEVIKDAARLEGFMLPATQATATMQLTAAEQAWLEQHPRIRVANETDWPPYDFAVNGEPSGYSIDMVKLVAKKAGLQLEFINGYSWDELLQMSREGKIDLFPAIWKTPERETFLNFTSPYAETPHILLIREGDNRINGITDLNGRSLAGIKGYADVEMVKQHYPGIKVHEVANITEGLRAVAYGHADAYLGTLGAVSHALRETQITGLKILGETTLEGRVQAGEMHFATRKELPLLTSIMQKGLNAVSREERMVIQDRWLFTRQDISDAPSLTEQSSLGWITGITVSLALLTLVAIILLPRLISNEKLTDLISSTRFRVTVLAGLALMVTLILLLVEQTIRHHYQQEIDSTRSELELVLKMAAERVDDWEREQKRYLLQLGRDAELIRLTKQLQRVPSDPDTLSASPELASVRRFFNEQADGFSTGFFIITPDGINIGSRRDSNLGTYNLIAQQRPDLFQLALSGEAVFVPPIESDVHITPGKTNDSSQKPNTMFFAVPITAQDGSVLAVMTQRLRPDGQLTELMKYGRIGRSGESYVIDQSGHVVTSSRFAEQLIEVGLLQRSERAHGRLIVSDPGGNLLDGYQPELEREKRPLTLMARSLLNESAGAVYEHEHHDHQGAHTITSDMSGYRDYRGVPVFGAWIWNPHLGMGITTEIDVDEAMAGYSTLRRNLFIITSLTLLLAISAVVVTLILSSRATAILRRSHDELEEMIAERTGELQQATIEAQQANRAKSEFLSSMSHELRTPLNAILGFSQLLEGEANLTAEQKENVQDILRAGSHLLSLINEVLDLSKIEAGRLELSLEPVPLDDIMGACQKLIEPLAQQHGVALQLSADCFAGHRLRADYTRTKQVLLNLLSNAIKYNRQHGSVSVHCQQLDGMLRINVQDTGPGIPAHKLDKLFEAFNRLGAESGTIEGTGIGLIITRQLVEMMGGELRVESIEGEGSTFWFTLPWIEQQQEAMRPSVPPQAPRQAPRSPRLQGRQKVLYIEDNPVNLKLVQKLIAKQTELQLIPAEEPVSGIELAVAERPDLILLDINLPTMSGYEVVAKLRTMAETQDIPIIALTANAMADDLIKGEKAGFDDYLTKPIQVKGFLEMLQRYLGG